ncbi:hypothetical protein D3C77_473910 [compost metagenome]
MAPGDDENATEVGEGAVGLVGAPEIVQQGPHLFIAPYIQALIDRDLEEHALLDDVLQGDGVRL